MYITLDSFKFLKSFDIFESIENYKTELEKSEVTGAAEFISVLKEKYQSHTKLKSSKISMQINDKMDVMIKLFSI